MVKRNPEHYRAEFTFGDGNTGQVSVVCSCGKYAFKTALNDAIAWLELHHDGLNREDIYK